MIDGGWWTLRAGGAARSIDSGGGVQSISTLSIDDLV